MYRQTQDVTTDETKVTCTNCRRIMGLDPKPERTTKQMIEQSALEAMRHKLEYANKDLRKFKGALIKRDETIERLRLELLEAKRVTKTDDTLRLNKELAHLRKKLRHYLGATQYGNFLLFEED